MDLYRDAKGVRDLVSILTASEGGETIHLEGMVSGALPLYSAAVVASFVVHLFVAEDRDAAAYLLNDLYELIDEESVHFLPSSYKRSMLYGNEDANSVVQRTTAQCASPRT